MAKIIDGKKISQEIKDELKERVAALKEKGVEVTLAVIQVGSNPASTVYVGNKKKACAYVGIKSLAYELPEETTEAELLELVEKLNKDDSVNGILVQLPLPKHIDENKVLLRILPEKDVDGFHPYNVGLLSIGKADLKACTPAGCIELIKRSGVDITGKKCVVVGRSNIVGKPVGMLLLAENGTVITCHSKTKDIASVCREADILVGTQMIVKGHDFPGVTLVGVIAADMSLYSSDYCANERTFQLICQAAGRAGRGELPGIAIVQTYSPDNYSIETAGRQNYEEFYEEEIAYRKLMKYPPVSNMVSILLQGREQKQLIEVTNYLVEIIKNYKDKYFKELFVIGPADPPVGKINDIYRKIIYLKSDSRQGIIQLKNYLEDVINSSQKFKKINIQFDFKA